jgi:hypothetical protein
MRFIELKIALTHGARSMCKTEKIMTKPQCFSRGQLVEIRSSAEIAATLDANGKLDGVPFMPEMARYCGNVARVSRRADKTCVAGVGIRRMRDTVFLEELRCDGGFHDDCQRNCLFFWKEAWLKPAASHAAPSRIDGTLDRATSLWISELPTRQLGLYSCQSTELFGATEPLSRWSFVPFMREIVHGELSVKGFLKIAYRATVHRLFRWKDPGRLVGPEGRKFKGNLNLQAGEWVDVKNAEEIQATLNPEGINCGLAFRPTMAEAIGGRYQVAFPVQKIILEQTGKMVHLTNTVALKGVVCQGTCAANCPRAEYLYWRESWLRRVDADAEAEHPARKGSEIGM